MALGLVASAAWPPAAAADDVAGMTALPAPTDYLVGPGDLIGIEVLGEQDLSGEYRVNGTGAIAMHLLGAIGVSQLTPLQIGDEVARLLRDGGFLVSPSVVVRVVEFKSQTIEVVGGVSQPGVYYLTGSTQLSEIIAEAGWIDAEKSTGEALVRRRTGEIVRVDLHQLMSSGEGNVVLRAGDQVSVGENQMIYVTGAVAKPGEVVFQPGITAVAALTQAGGASVYARLDNAYVLRDGERIPVNIKRVQRGREPDVALQPGDTLIIRESPI